MASKQTYKCKFNSTWCQDYPVRAVKGNIYQFYCVPCVKKLTCHHQGVKDVSDHCKKNSHKANVIALKKQTSLNNFLKTDTTLDNQVINAEVMVTNFLVQHNISLATSDHLTSLFKEVFPDSKIAKRYAASRTKTMAIINESFAPHCRNYIVEHCKVHPYSLGTDGSNDSGIDKMNPICIKIFDANRSKTITCHFFDMCLTSGVDCAKAAVIFSSIEKKFEVYEIPWENCISLSVDNTNSMIGKRNSVASRFLEKNNNIFIGGCPCHFLAHLAASKAHDVFCDYIALNVENVMIDLYYWFDKSAKRKGKLREYFEFCNQEYQGILKHLSVRWLSLEKCISRAIVKYTSLKAYFSSESFADERFKRLYDKFHNPILEPAMLFLTSALPLFLHFNLLLQREEPTIHCLKSAMESLGKKLAKRIILPNKLKNISSVLEIDLEDSKNYIDTQDIYLGVLTKQKLRQLFETGDISQKQYKEFHDAAHYFFKSSLKYIKHKFPLNDDLIVNSGWVDVLDRENSKWEQVQYFYDRFPHLMNGIKPDELYEEFSDYQILKNNDFDDVFEEAKIPEKILDDIGGEPLFHYRIDVLWYHISKMVIPNTLVKRFKLLPKLAEIVLIIPHSNAELERLFSIVKKNKCLERSALKLDGTLSSILAMKTMFPEATIPCFQWKPSEQLLKTSKKATKMYNAKHNE